MYINFPYPNHSKDERGNIFAAELCRYRYIGLEKIMSNARIIDGGCGTGYRVIPIAKYFSVKEYMRLAI